LIIDKRGLKVECYNEVGEFTALTPIGKFAAQILEDRKFDEDYLVWSKFYPVIGTEPFIYKRRF
jgi:hypothetical protein